MYTRMNSCRKLAMVIAVGAAGMALLFLALDRMHHPSSTDNMFFMDQVFAKISTGMEQSGGIAEPPSLEEAARRCAQENVIIMTIICYPLRDMFMNFYHASLAKHDLQNVLFLSTDHESCNFLFQQTQDPDVTCYKFRDDSNPSKPPSFGTFEHTRMTNYKTEMGLKLLSLGYTVLISDTDIIYITNPMPILADTCKVGECDLAVQSEDPHHHNSGFMFVHPTDASIGLFERMLAIAEETNKTNQFSLNQALRTEFNSEDKIKLVVLDPQRFPNGPRFFPAHGCPNEELYEDLVIVHNNYLIEVEDKNLRFRECNLWIYDGEDAYYTSTTRKYLKHTRDLEKSEAKLALMNAFVIGFFLNRTLILPRLADNDQVGSSGNGFHLVRHVFLSCHWLEHVFDLSYRESNFLDNEYVPLNVIESISSVYEIEESATNTPESIEETVLLPDDPDRGATVEELRAWFGSLDVSVLTLKPVVEEHENFPYKEIFGADNIIFQ